MTKKLLCVDEQANDRSQTMMRIFSQDPYNYMTMVAGSEPNVVFPLTRDNLAWPDEILCANDKTYSVVMHRLEHFVIKDKKVINFSLWDIYNYNDPELISKLKTIYDAQNT